MHGQLFRLLRKDKESQTKHAFADVGISGTKVWTTELGTKLGVVAGWRPWYLAIPDSFGIQVSISVDP